MKANEIQIGDWVYIEDAEKESGLALTKVVCITEDNTEWLHPIPLTAEILENNGIDQENCYLTNINDEYFQLHIEIDGVELFKRIFYIHELQHALRLCGLNDLAENFKI